LELNAIIKKPTVPMEIPQVIIVKEKSEINLIPVKL
jgi:hypothetical protein